MVRYLGPYVTVCNDWNYWWTYLSEHISEETTFGFAQRALLNQTNPLQTNNVGTQGASAPVNGGIPTVPSAATSSCTARTTARRSTTMATPTARPVSAGIRRSSTTSIPRAGYLAVDAHTPGDQGPTFTGRAHVPAGETFTRNPQTGPQLLPNPSNP